MKFSVQTGPRITVAESGFEAVAEDQHARPRRRTRRAMRRATRRLPTLHADSLSLGLV